MMTAHQWKRELLLHRIGEIGDVPWIIDGIRYYGGGPDTHAIIKQAIAAYEQDRLDLCERRAWKPSARACVVTMIM
jgi:hypothetical protein